MYKDNRNPLIIIDIGALGGLGDRWSNFNFKAILFEPNKEASDELLTDCPSNITVVNSALSDSNKDMTLYVCKKASVSSVYRPNTGFIKKFTDAERFDILEEIRVKTDTLDNTLANKGISDPDFIKVDVQGYELPILRGSIKSLKRVIGVEAEVEFAPMYKGQPLFSDLDPFMRENGFELYDFGMMNHWKRIGDHSGSHCKGQLIWADAIYFRSPESIVNMKDISGKKIAKAIYIYLAYEAINYAHVLLDESRQSLLIDEDEYHRLKGIINRFEKDLHKKRRADRVKKYRKLTFGF